MYLADLLTFVPHFLRSCREDTLAAPIAGRRTQILGACALALACGAALPACSAPPEADTIRVDIDFDDPGRRVRRLRISDMAVLPSRSDAERFDLVVDGFMGEGQFLLRSGDRRNLILVGVGDAAAFQHMAQGLEPWDSAGLFSAAENAGVDQEDDFVDYWSTVELEAKLGQIFAVRADETAKGDRPDVAALLRVGAIDQSGAITFAIERAPTADDSEPTEAAEAQPAGEDAASLFDRARTRALAGDLEAARSDLSRSLKLTLSPGPAAWLAALGGGTEALEASAPGSEWHAQLASWFRGEIDNKDLMIFTMNIKDRKVRKPLWCERLFYQSLRNRLDGSPWKARRTLFSCVEQGAETQVGRWAREVLLHDQAANAVSPPLPALKVHGLVEATEVLAATRNASPRFREFVHKHFTRDVFENESYHERGLPGAFAQATYARSVSTEDVFGGLLQLTRGNASRWEFLADSYMAAGVYEAVDEPLQCARAWSVLQDMWRTLSDGDASSQSKCAVLRLLPSISELAAWQLLRVTIEFNGQDDDVVNAILELVGQRNFTDIGALDYLADLFAPARTAALIEAHYRLPYRLSPDSPLLEYLQAHRNEPRYTEALVRLAPNRHISMRLTTEEFSSGALKRSLDAAQLPAGTRVGHAYVADRWDSLGVISLEVRFLPEQQEEVESQVRAVFEAVLGKDEVEKRVAFWSGRNPSNEW